MQSRKSSETLPRTIRTAVVRRKDCVCASAGTFAVISLMIGGVAVREAPDSMFYVSSANGSNSSLILNETARDARRVQVAIALTTMVGLIQVSLRTFSRVHSSCWRIAKKWWGFFGNKTVFSLFCPVCVSWPLASLGSALWQSISQSPWFEASPPQPPSTSVSPSWNTSWGWEHSASVDPCLSFMWVQRRKCPRKSHFWSVWDVEGSSWQRVAVLLALPQSVMAVVGDIASTNVTTLILGLACLIFLYGIKDLNERFKKRLAIPIPGEIIIVIVSTGVSYGLSLSSDYNVDVVGQIPTG